MAPACIITPPEAVSQNLFRRENGNTFGDWRQDATSEGFVVEAWGEGFMLGALMIMACITVANMRTGVILHKLILLELFLAMAHGTFCFMAFHGYGWYLSGTATFLYCSYFLHNVIAWIKIRPFFTGPHSTFSQRTSRIVSRVFLTTLAMTAPILIVQIYNNFRFFNNISLWYKKVRPYEPVFRDPWWIFSCMVLFHVIRTCYNFSVFALIKRSPRFGILLAAICLSMAFTIMDILSSILPQLSVVDGINPYWKLALVFKALTDNIMLDDFKTVLKRLGSTKMNLPAASGLPNTSSLPSNDKVLSGDRNEIENAARRQSEAGHRFSLSGRALESDEILDLAGRGRRKQSVAARDAIGHVGAKIHHLPRLPSLPAKFRYSVSKKKPMAEIDENHTNGVCGELQTNGLADGERQAEGECGELTFQQMLKKDSVEIIPPQFSRRWTDEESGEGGSHSPSLSPWVDKSR